MEPPEPHVAPTVPARSTLRDHLSATWAWRPRRVARALLTLLVVTDLAFIAIYLLNEYAGLGFDRGSITIDWGVPEIYGYFKLGWSSLILAWLALRLRDPLLAVLGGATGLAMLDDAARLHERAGVLIEDRFPPDVLRAVDWLEPGDVVYVAVVGLGLAVAVLVAWRFASDRGRTIGAGALVALVALVFAGVVLEVVNAPGAFKPLTELLDDGTELLAVSLLLTHVAGWWDLLADPEAGLSGP